MVRHTKSWDYYMGKKVGRFIKGCLSITKYEHVAEKNTFVGAYRNRRFLIMGLSYYWIFH